MSRLALDNNTVAGKNNFVRVHLGWLRRYVRAILAPLGIDNDQSSNHTADEPFSYETGAIAPASI